MPPPFRGRQPLGKTLRETDRQTRANRVTGGPGVLVSTSAGGIAVSVPGSGNRLGKITTTITAASGSGSAFTLGKGKATIFGVKDSGSNKVTMAIETDVDVYNVLSVSVAARALPVILIEVGGLLFISVADCPP